MKEGQERRLVLMLPAAPFRSSTMLGIDGLRVKMVGDTSECRSEETPGGNHLDSSSISHLENDLDDLFTWTDTGEATEVVDAQHGRRVGRAREVDNAGRHKKESYTK